MCNDSKIGEEGPFSAPNFGFRRQILKPRFRFVSCKHVKELVNSQRAVNLSLVVCKNADATPNLFSYLSAHLALNLKNCLVVQIATLESAYRDRV